MWRYGAGVALLSGVLACNPATARPAFGPFPEAAAVEVELPVPQATERLADVLEAARIPVVVVEPRDGYLETAWFEAATGEPTGQRPLGPDVVRVRAWVDPSRPDWSRLSVGGVYRPVADPSLPDRDLDVPLPAEHPVMQRVRQALEQLR